MSEDSKLKPTHKLRSHEVCEQEIKAVREAFKLRNHSDLQLHEVSDAIFRLRQQKVRQVVTDHFQNFTPGDLGHVLDILAAEEMKAREAEEQENFLKVVTAENERRAKSGKPLLPLDREAAKKQVLAEREVEAKESCGEKLPASAEDCAKVPSAPVQPPTPAV